MNKEDNGVNDLIVKYQSNGDKEALKGIFKQYKPLIDSSVRIYSSSGIPDSVLNARAKLIMANAVKNYDVKKGDPSGYFKNSMKSLYRDIVKLNPLYVPENRYNKIKSVMEMKDDLGNIQVDDVVDDAGVSAGEAQRMIDDSGTTFAVGDLDGVGKMVDSEESIWNHVYKITKDPRERMIMDLAYGTNGMPKVDTDTDMAKLLGMSESNVRKLKDRIIQRIYEESE